MTQPKLPTPPWRIGVDVGGTFTDLVLADAQGRIWLAKVPSVPADPSQGVLDAIEHLARELGTGSPNLMQHCTLFVHGSTVATNTMLEAKGARVGLIGSEGFRDCLEIRRGLREDQWDHRAPYAPVLVPRYLRKGVRGRIDADGSEHQPLDLSGLDEILQGFDAEGVQAIAVALLNSFLDDAHESAVVEAIRARRPEAWVSASADISPLMGEYERTSTAVVNAALLPRVAAYLRALERRLQALGLARPVLMLQSNGGTTSVDRVSARPVNLLLSGPAAAVGALNLYRRAIDRRLADHGEQGNLISMEIGGTSCDVLLMAEGEVATRDDISIAGYHVSTPAIDIHTVGAGGGTIAGVDEAGLLFVGPEGAGASPGPACYGRGGTRPTVTDAQLVLGRLRAGRSSGGTLDLDMDAARRAIATEVAEPLGLSVEQAAVGIVNLLDQHLLHAVEYISIERGHAPRRFTLVAAGGAGPMHGVAIARGLGAGRVYVPRVAGALCAMGMLEADIRQDFVQFMLAALEETAASRIESELDALTRRATGVLGEEGFGLDAIRVRRELDLQYQSQLWTIKVGLPDGRVDPALIREAFEREYRRLYGHVQPDGVIMICGVRVIATAPSAGMRLDGGPPATAAPAAVERREVWHPQGADTGGWLSTPVYAGVALHPGHHLIGPALVEEQTTTVLLGPGDELQVDEDGNYFIELAGAAPDVATAMDNDVSARDPVTLALMQNRLDQISRHMGWVMTRTARSTIFSQSHDFSCFVTAPDGTLVANADGIPIHTGG
ncbi:MAG: hydantoinase B/oxoprolinase family protein, partial [Gammaproteobacteria bacterium]|nr:hydantoinase B/oxoprolinase family protein [Gammaproteobacteria bacterium]